ncbi:MAG: ABC transporter substrate-binding protein [Opitutaceae bacterium]|nr:ABC transporter substrate-binding protein [Opitutaceae bacterium]
MTDLTLAFLPLSDAAPLIVAHARGHFREHGIRSTLHREANWTALRDSLNTGRAHAAQMLYSMPLAAACGLLGENQVPLIVPWVLNRNGQGITLHLGYRGQVVGDARALRARAHERRDLGRPLVFCHTLRVGTHALWLRYWLAAGGIDPTRDVALITVPPPQMVANMRAGSVDGFCVGEPWNARALADALGFTALATQELWPDHPEKVCAFTEAWSKANPEATVAALRALHQAGHWLDDPAHHAEAAALLAQPEYLACDPALIRARQGAAIDYGDGRSATLVHGPSFAGRGLNCPQSSHALWFLSQLRRWGLHYGVPDYAGITSRVLRPDLHAAATGETPAPEPISLADGGLFDPADPEGYARGFAIKHLLG